MANDQSAPPATYVRRMTRILLFPFFALSMLILPEARGELLVSWTNLERDSDGVLEATIARH